MIAQRRTEQVLVKKRMEVVFLFFLGLVVLLAGRLTYVQGILGPQLNALARTQEIRNVNVDAKRGSILDRNNNELAQDVQAKSICINPRLVADPAVTAARLAELLKLDDPVREALRAQLERGKQLNRAYSRLRRRVDRRLAQQILELSAGKKKEPGEPALRGLFLEECPTRVNPSGRDGRQLIGEVGSDGHGLEALEKQFDAVLSGRDGQRRVTVDATGAAIPNSLVRISDPLDGKDVRLTLDRDLQHITETELYKAVEERKPDAAAAIVMDPRSGEVLAMANWPAFDPEAKEIKPEQRRNRAVTDLFEPGSIFKVVTACAALEHGVNTHTQCTGSHTIGKYTMHCAHSARHGSVDLRKMIEQSCNLAAGTLAVRVGADDLYKFLESAGFQSKTGIEFPGEEYDTPDPPDKWKTLRTYNIGFGQGIAITPIQLLAFYSAVANDGIYNPPHLVLDVAGAPPVRKPPHRLLTVAHAATVRECMQACVNTGTGKSAKIPGYSVGGKTGTAQIAGRGGYNGAYVGSFAGFLPVEKPRLAIIVSMWHPRVGEYGGVVAGPVFREIARQAVNYLKIPPDDPHDLRDGADPGTFYRYSSGSARGSSHNSRRRRHD
jgi:stage V sporulation protein D (sporulation-specific penicillin-binding protein)